MDKPERKDTRENNNARDQRRRNNRQDNAVQPQGFEAFCCKCKDVHGSMYVYDTAACAPQYNKTNGAITECLKLNSMLPMDV